jgi:hypothetical protein
MVEDAFDAWYWLDPRGFACFAAMQETVHLRHDVRRVCRRCDAQEVVFLQVLAE